MPTFMLQALVDVSTRQIRRAATISICSALWAVIFEPSPDCEIGRGMAAGSRLEAIQRRSPRNGSLASTWMARSGPRPDMPWGGQGWFLERRIMACTRPMDSGATQEWSRGRSFTRGRGGSSVGS